jgi:hypothetical protein
MPIVLPLSAIGRSHLGNPNSNKEKQIWVIRGKKTKARRNNGKRLSLIQRKNENKKKRRRSKFSGALLAYHFSLRLKKGPLDSPIKCNT